MSGGKAMGAQVSQEMGGKGDMLTSETSWASSKWKEGNSICGRTHSSSRQWHG